MCPLVLVLSLMGQYVCGPTGCRWAASPVVTSSICTSVGRGEHCPPDGVRHWMRGVLPGGETVSFQGYHQGAERYYLPAENEALHLLVQHRTVPPVTPPVPLVTPPQDGLPGVRRQIDAKAVMDYGVDIVPSQQPVGTVIRTNDYQFGTWFEATRPGTQVQPVQPSPVLPAPSADAPAFDLATRLPLVIGAVGFLAAIFLCIAIIFTLLLGNRTRTT